jgi:hypothetical protein
MARRRQRSPAARGTLHWAWILVACLAAAPAGAGVPSRVISTNAQGAASVVAADIDGDDDLDVLSASTWDDKIAWYENVEGDGTTWTEHAISLTARGAASVLAADVDGDRDLDVLSASTYNDRIAWYENLVGDGSAWIAHVISLDAFGAASVGAADVDGDGDVDALSASLYDDTVAWYENRDGTGSTWTRHVVTFDAFGATSVVAADVDGDDDLDVLSASIWDDTVAWHENLSGDGSAWIAHVISVNTFGAVSVFAGDVDGDDDPDVLSASLYDDTIAWHENVDGNGFVWTEHPITVDAFGASSVVAADVDGDLDLDVLSAATWDNEIAWHENVAGDGSVWAQSIISIGASGASSVFAADLDGDGDLDALSAWRYVDTVAWHENQGSGFPLLFADDFESGDASRWSSIVP